MKTSSKMAAVETTQEELKVLLEFQKAIDGNTEGEIAHNAAKYIEASLGFTVGVIFLKQDGKTVEVVSYTGTDSVNHPDFFNYFVNQQKQFKIPASSKYYSIRQSVSAIDDPVLIPGRWKGQSKAFFVTEELDKANSQLLKMLCNEFARTIAHKQQSYFLHNLHNTRSTILNDIDGQDGSPIDGSIKNLAVTGFDYKSVAEKKILLRDAQLKALNAALNEVALLIITNLKGEIIDVNGRFSKITKYGKDELIGQNYGLFKSDFHPPAFYRNIWTTIKRGEIWKGEISTQDKNGKQIWLFQTIIPFQAGNDGEAFYYAFGADITKQKEREYQQQISREDLEKKLKIKEDFISIMSHELRTPLNAVLGISQLLQKVTADKNQNELIDILNSSAKNLLNLINNLLDYSKIEAQKFKVSMDAFNLHQSVEKLKSSFEHTAKEKGLDFELEVEDGTPEWIIGDELRLTQILNNLVSNAIKYTAFGFIKIKVDGSELDGENGLLTIEVKDSGQGMKNSDLQLIFNAFEQVGTNQANSLQSTGLGLSIVKTLVALMNGQITVESEYKNGSCFILKIPFQLTDGPHKFELEDDIAESPKLDGKKILYVEDVVANQFLMKNVLESYGGSCSVVDNGSEAIDLCNTTQFDLLLMDIKMPDMSGYEAAQRIRDLKDYINVPIIAFTANTSEEVQKEIKGAGMNELLSKPVDLEKLADIFRKYLPQHSVTKHDKIDTSFFTNAFSNHTIKLQNYFDLVIIEINDFQESINDFYAAEDYDAIKDEIHKIEPIILKFKFEKLLRSFDNFKKHNSFSEQLRADFADIVKHSASFIQAIKNLKV